MHHALLVVTLDRLTRSVRDLADLLDVFSDGRRSLLSVGEQIDTRGVAVVLSQGTSVISSKGMPFSASAMRTLRA